MKRIFLFIVIMLAGALPQMSAQESVTVHVAGQSLESLLTEEQKQSVKSLIVTGTLAEADYAYLRSGLLNQLDTLNLRQAEIDTIPKLAFYCELSSKCPERRIILPEGLKHFADSSLWSHLYGDELVLVLTGDYPSNGSNVYSEPVYGTRIIIEPSADNTKYKLIDDILCSADGSVLYRTNKMGVYVPDGVRVIYSNAFECCLIGGFADIPGSVDSIGDRAFAHIQILGDWDGKPDIAYLIFHSPTPPKLGKDVFVAGQGEFSHYEWIYADDEYLDLYLAADGWKDVINGGESLALDIDSPNDGDEGVVVTADGNSYSFSSDKPITRISIFDAIGRLLYNRTVNSDEAIIPKSVSNSSLIIVKVNFADGTTETLKLQL